MINITDEGIILEKTDLEFESLGVLNPGCIEIDGIIHMFYRAVGPKSVSTIGYCQLKNDKVIKRLTQPLLVPEYDYEKAGLEDPRIVYLENKYYLFYTAYDGKNALTAYAVSDDLVNFKKCGLLSYKIAYAKATEYFTTLRLSQRYMAFEAPYVEDRGKDVLLWQKDTSIFPKKINGKYAMVYRILPGIQIIYFDEWKDLNEEYWINYFKTFADNIILDPENEFENYYIGSGCPPIETKDGWLLIYHAVERTATDKIYRAGAALLDLENPKKIIGRLPYPLFGPKEPWEMKGITAAVVFPSGAVIENNLLHIYYGAADSVIGAKSLILSDLLTELKNNPPQKDKDQIT